MKDIKLSVIIVSYNTRQLLRGALSSVLAGSTGFPVEIIVVDNSSGDGSVEMVRSEFPSVNVIANEDNKGFAAANNQALNIASGEYILLLNSDTVVQDISVLDSWISFMDSNKDVGLSGVKLVFPDGRHQVGDAGHRPSIMSVFSHAFLLSKALYPLFKGVFLSKDLYSGVHYVDWICGAALMLRHTLVADIGGLDESVFMYAEDVEYGCRARDRGYKAAYLPYLRIIHLQGGSDEKKDGITFTWIRNLRELYCEFNPSTVSGKFFDILFGAGFLLRSVIYGIFGIILFKKDLFKKSRNMFYSSKYVFGFYSERIKEV